jgi:hypothetical protein
MLVLYSAKGKHVVYLNVEKGLRIHSSQREDVLKQGKLHGLAGRTTLKVELFVGGAAGAVRGEYH